MSQICPVCGNEIAEDADACPYCGFKLLGSTQSFKPLNMDEAVTIPRSEAKHAHLKVVRGPQTGIVIEVGQGRQSIGRNPQCDIFLNDMTVSRKHAYIESTPEGCIIRDLNSFNGVWVNNESVEACLLKSGDLIQIGAFCLIYQES